MKRYGYLYEKIYDIENLKLAHKNASKGKSHYDEVKIINSNPLLYLNKIQDMLITESFVNGPYTIFIKNDRGKQREIFKLPYFPDRIIHHAIMQILEPIWKKTLIKDTFQSIKGRGVESARKRMTETIRKHKSEYCLKLDIKKFYPSIDNNILKNILKLKIKCKRTLNLLFVIIDSTVGVPIGNYLSQYFGNLYLSYFDHFIKEKLKVKYYFRYCDDFILMHKSKKFLHKCLGLIKDYVGALNLTLKSNYQLFPIYLRGVDFVGYRFFEEYTLLRKSIATKFKQSGKRILKSCRININLLSSLFSYYGWALHCDCYNLIKSVISPEMVAHLKANNLKHRIIRST